MAVTINADTTNGVIITPDTSGEIKLQSAGTDIASVTANGIDVTGDFTVDTTTLHVDATNNRVGIGTTTPSQTLHVVGGQSYVTGSAGNGAYSRWYNNAQTSSDLQIGQGWSSGSDNVGFVLNNANADLLFGTNGSERMRLTSSGEVYIAGTTDQGAYNLQCNGTGVWGAGAYVNGSDERIKENITSLDSGLDVIAKLNPVTYKYKEDWSKDQSTQTGFIAQELLVALEGKNYADGIVQQGGEYMSVAYQNIIPLLTKAIQEQQDIIKALETKIQALENA